eukprot:131664_1
MTITNTSTDVTVIMGHHIMPMIRMTLTNTSTVITGHHIMPMIRMTITNTSTVIMGPHIIRMTLTNASTVIMDHAAEAIVKSVQSAANRRACAVTHSRSRSR